MLEIAVSVIAMLVLAAVGLLVWLILTNSANRRETTGQAAAIGLLQLQLEALKAAQDKQTEKLAESLQAGHTNLSQGMAASQKVLSLLNTQIGELQGTNKQMLTVGTEVRKLQDILSSPKLRGQIGEWSLKNLLENVLPKDSFHLQYPFKDGRIVDALVKMNSYSVPIDAKFPLPAFERLAKCDGDEDRLRQRKQFQSDVIKHIDKIADSYIRPAEGTLDFAMCYIPAENVYYETIIRHDGDSKNVLEYAMEKKVIPVSPNLLYAYLMTVVMGLHGLQIEKQAAEIRQNLKSLNASFSAFASTYDTLGKHLRNAQNQYDEGDKKLNKFGMQLDHIQAEDGQQKSVAGV